MFEHFLDLPLHLAVYRLCPDARAVVHAHPPVATAWTIARPELTALPAGCVAEVLLGLLANDKTAWINVNPSWTPSIPLAGEHVTLADIIRFATEPLPV